ncbi:MAG: VOC family protein [Acidimicrobiia bacterium]|nr:VOC family protein [Acidimicrobiia bacterium]
MTDLRGVHHLALSTGDLKAQIEFFTDVLGAELTAMFWMHNMPDAVHAFLKIDDFTYIAFVQSPESQALEEPGLPELHFTPPRGAMQHVAFHVDSEDKMLAYRDRARSKGLYCMGPIDHGFCKSVYLPGPEGLQLEVAFANNPIDGRRYIDPEIVEKLGISEADLSRYTKPEPTRGEGGAIPQVTWDDDDPQWNIPAHLVDVLTTLSDEEITELMSVVASPVGVGEG